MTKDYQIGFGSFSDKPMVPFAMEKSRYKELRKPTPYAFQHHLDLTTDVKEFERIIRDIDPKKQMPANVDSPESGLDAMAQAMLCNEVVGWRKNDKVRYSKPLHKICTP